MTGAYSFICDYNSTDSLLARFQQIGNWTWIMGDSHWYGDYLAARPFPGVRIRIVDFPTLEHGGYCYKSDVRLRSPECKTPMSVIDEVYRNLLAQVPAHHIEEIEWFD